MLSLDEALAELGETPDAISAALIEKGITGARKDDGCCPIAVYLSGIYACPMVTENIVEAWDEDGEAEVWTFTPDAAVAFIQRFDRGEWPELVAEVAE